MSLPTQFQRVAPQARHCIEEKHKNVEVEMWCFRSGLLGFMDGLILQRKSSGIVLRVPTFTPGCV